MKYLLLLFTAVLSSEQTFESFQSELYTEFLSGFFSGLTNNNVACVTSASTTSESFNSMVNTIKSYNSNYLPILTSFTLFKEDLTSMAEACNVQGLVLTVQKLLGPWGKTTFMRNYLLHSRQVSKDLEVLKSCSQDFETCGYSAGEIFRLLSGWSIKMSLTENSFGKELDDMEKVLSGVISTVEWMAPEYCAEVPRRFPVKEAFEGWISYINGEKGALERVFSKVLEVWSTDEDLQDCALHYGGMALYVLPNVLSNPSTWTLAYETESSSINNAFNRIMSSCSSDYSTCGTQIGSLVNLLLQYTHEL